MDGYSLSSSHYLFDGKSRTVTWVRSFDVQTRIEQFLVLLCFCEKAVTGTRFYFFILFSLLVFLSKVDYNKCEQLLKIVFVFFLEIEARKIWYNNTLLTFELLLVLFCGLQPEEPVRQSRLLSFVQLIIIHLKIRCTKDCNFLQWYCSTTMG